MRISSLLKHKGFVKLGLRPNKISWTLTTKALGLSSIKTIFRMKIIVVMTWVHQHPLAREMILVERGVVLDVESHFISALLGNFATL